MDAVDRIIDELGYGDSPHYVPENQFDQYPAFAHVFRQARDFCGLRGVYGLRRGEGQSGDTIIPLIYVCKARDESHAQAIHRLVWNQNTVPFAIVATSANVRLYSGFAYAEDESATPARQAAQVLSRVIDWKNAGRELSAFRADSVDSGHLWDVYGQHVTPEYRVDWQLLDNLEHLGSSLRNQLKLSPRLAHSLIGKYVYLRYLRNRKILSDDKFSDFGISPESVFSRNAKLSSVRLLVRYVDEWLNGSIFPINWSAGVRAEHVRLVAATFFGDDPASGQGSLFEKYDFSYIPVETLSVVYEQFLHAEGRGKSYGAYYTPIPLVNFILDEVEDLRPPTSDMRVLDPSCGSGAFLVQCYRRMIERALARSSNGTLLKSQLRSILQNSIFGIDRDADAVAVTELSLTLTLLDYVSPPDLRDTNFKLPRLRDTNIFKGDFFDGDSPFSELSKDVYFDWIVGNPPWTEFSDSNTYEAPAISWHKRHLEEYPIGGNQLAELFAWKATKHIVDNDSAIGLLLPAMTLFKKESRHFRQAFFSRCQVESVVNFANLAYVLFAGRSRVPAAAFFYRTGCENRSHNPILTYAPLMANQIKSTSHRLRKRRDTWCIIVDGSALREVDAAYAASGSSRVWKVAMWGSFRDSRVLDALEQKWTSLGSVAKKRNLHIHSGFEPRTSGTPVREFVGKQWINIDAIADYGNIFHLPTDTLEDFPAKYAYARPGRDKMPVLVSRPPHIISDAARRFAIFTDKYVVIRARQPAIAGPASQDDYLRLLAMYLNSELAIYHQFLTSPQWGVSKSRADLDTLRDLPVIVENLSDSEKREWLDLYRKLKRSSPRKARRLPIAEGLFSRNESDDEDCLEYTRLLRELNDRVYARAGLDNSDRVFVEDFVRTRMTLIQGKASGAGAVGPKEDEFEQYAQHLKDELDNFMEGGASNHVVKVHVGTSNSAVEISIQSNRRKRLAPSIVPATSNEDAWWSEAMKTSQHNVGQWIYFNRNLRFYRRESNSVIIVKPNQKINWLRSQALLDADSIISEIVLGTH